MTNLWTILIGKFSQMYYTNTTPVLLSIFLAKKSGTNILVKKIQKCPFRPFRTSSFGTILFFCNVVNLVYYWWILGRDRLERFIFYFTCYGYHCGRHLSWKELHRKPDRRIGLRWLTLYGQV